MTAGQQKTPERAPSKRERLLYIVTTQPGRYVLGRNGHGPYALRGETEFRLTDKGHRDQLHADLRRAWRDTVKGDDPPAEALLREVVADLRAMAMDAKPDVPTPAEEASAMRAASEFGPDDDADYFDDEQCTFWRRPAQGGGSVPVMLATFTARIAEEVTLDDGADPTITWLLRVVAQDGRCGEIRITPDQLGRPQLWAAKAAGTSALVMPGQAIADHLRVAVQSRSGSVVRKTVFTHAGWRHVGAGHAYLTSTGALGADGLDESITVDLGPLSGYALPDVRDVRAAIREAVQASIALLEIAPDQVMVPVMAATYRAPLPLAPDCSVWQYGRSGTFKTSISALAQQHFGATMDAYGLPGNWTSTGNALEMQAFTLANALFVVDDYSPDVTKVDAQRRAAAADRLMRGSANRSGRGRLRPDGSQRPEKPPRSQILSSAEDLPPSIESLLARVFVAEVTPGSVNVAMLTAAQKQGGDGQFALAMAGYIAHLARRWDSEPQLTAKLADVRAALRDKARAIGQHPRSALNIASLALGYLEFAAYAKDIGAVSDSDSRGLWTRAWKALCDVGAEQERYRRDSDPVRVYLRSIGALIASGRAHLTAPNGSPPREPSRWGWVDDRAGKEPTEWDPAATPRWRPMGDQLGWIDGDDVLLEPDAAYRAARQFAEAAGIRLGVTKHAVHKHLHERDLLATTQGAGHLTARRRLGGALRNVVHLTVTSFDGAGGQ